MLILKCRSRDLEHFAQQCCTWHHFLGKASFYKFSLVQVTVHIAAHSFNEGLLS